MATDKTSMKLRLKAIGKLVGDVTFARTQEMTPYQVGYNSGAYDVAQEVRRILNSPVPGHTDGPDAQAKAEYLKQEEETALKSWHFMTDEEKSKYIYREIEFSSDGEPLDSFFDFSDKVSEILPTAKVTLTEDKKVEVLTGTALLHRMDRGQSLAILGRKTWVVR